MKPRASKAGLQALCDRVWFLDNAIATGKLIVPDVEVTASPYADLGTIIHDELQTRLGCVMQTRMSEAMEPFRANAVNLFKDRSEMDLAIEAVVEFAASIFPKAGDGKPWLAEPANELSDLTGHLDFLSQDGLEIIDLKTTARKPDNARMKPLHLAQIVSYWDLMGRKAKTAKILYVDSLKGSWALLTDAVDFDSPFVQEYADGLRDRRKAMVSGNTGSAPSPGAHCKDGFCSYRNSKACYGSLVPPGESSTIFENKETKKVNPLASPTRKVPKLW